MPMHTRTLLAWIAVGLLGLGLAAGVTYAAMQLSSQRIGLSAEPPSAGEQLAPPRRTAAARRASGRGDVHPGERRRHAARRGERRHSGPPDD
jgi:hypothetical protein